MDLNADGWGSEAAADEVTRQIKQFAPLLTSDEHVTFAELKPLATVPPLLMIVATCLAVTFLTEGANGFITGQNIDIAGGVRL